MVSLLDKLAIGSAKLSAALVKRLKLGKASSLPGRVALVVNKNLLTSFAEQCRESKFSFFLTGTNGKTTCTGLLKSICQRHLQELAQNHYIICNDMGANLYYGICSELVHSSNCSGILRSDNYCFEIDEASLKNVAKILPTKNIIVTNIYRDQLDRFGELDSTQKLIVTGINQSLELKDKINIFLNADDNRVSDIEKLVDKAKASKAIFYNVIDQRIEDLDLSNKAKHEADFRCYIIQQNSDSSLIRFNTNEAESPEILLKLPGLYNVYNATAAAAAAYYNGIGFNEIKYGIETYQNVFGRSEIKTLNNKSYQVFLIKNPTGCTEVVKHLAHEPSARFLVAINDNYADGRDVSWLWDAKFEYLTQLINNAQANVYCSGKRAYDIALRLKYAGVQENLLIIEPNLKDALNEFTKTASIEQKLYVLPTYTALLEMS